VLFLSCDSRVCDVVASKRTWLEFVAVRGSMVARFWDSSKLVDATSCTGDRLSGQQLGFRSELDFGVRSIASLDVSSER
jgi:hypothetical protein